MSYDLGEEAVDPTHTVDAAQRSTVGARDGVAWDQVVGPSRRKMFVRARRRVARQLRQEGWSPREIGEVLNRHRTSILYLLEEPS